MRSFVFTLGFHEDFILRRLTSKAAQPGEPILVFTAKPAAGAVVRAFTSLQSFCSRVNLSEPELVELDISDEARALVEVKSRVELLPTPIIVDLSGGMRVLVVLTLLALMASRREFELYVVPETGMGGEFHMPRGVTRALSGLSREKLAILSEIARRPGVSAELIARRLGRSLKTIRNHLWELKRMGLVVSRGRGAPLRLSRWGEALALVENSR